MPLAKKPIRWPPHISEATGYNAFFLHDTATGVRFLIDTSATGVRFLIDTGATCSLLPASQWKKPHLPPSNVKLAAANGTPIPTYSHQHLTLRISKCYYSWNFVVADVTIPLLGADFLAHYQLLVDIYSCRLVDDISLNTTLIAAAPNHLALQVKDTSDKFEHLWHSYPDVFKPALYQHPPYSS